MTTDLHCHLLPGLDDGPETVADAVALARGIVASGVDRVVATPHVNHRYPTTAASIDAAAVRLRAALAGAGVTLEVLVGAEVAASHLPELTDTTLAQLTLGDSRWLLLEPPTVFELPYERAVDRLRQAGLNALVAHPERCRLFQQAPGRLAELVAGGAALSLTASSLTGAFGSAPKRLALRLVTEGLVANVAADAHDMHRRPPRLLEDLAHAGLTSDADAWCTRFPETVLGAPQPVTASDSPGTARPAAPDPITVATRMAADGSSRAAIEEHLHAHLPASIARRHLSRITGARSA